MLTPGRGRRRDGNEKRKEGQNSPHNLRNKRPLHPPFTIAAGEGPSSINHVLQHRVNRADLINLIICGKGAREREVLPS